MNRRIVMVFFAFWSALGLACGGGTEPSPEPPERPTGPTPMPRDPLLVFRDDFDGSSMDDGRWFMPEGAGTFFGRTQLRPARERLQVTNGVIRLRLDTHNPTARTPGDSFWGSEIVTRQTFDVGSGLSFSARVRLGGALPGGLVASLFSYALTGGVRDEIDFELLTNDYSRVLTNVFQADGFSTGGRPVYVSGIDASGFNELTIEWRATQIRWKVNGVIVRELVERVPLTPMSIRLNLWAPASDFAAAFNPSLQPSATAGGNQTYFYDVDWVEVRRLS
jgi:beta-glucanase (GH16 family)